MIDHLIYDFDGTISDSYPLFVKFFYEAAQKRGYRISCTPDEIYRASKQVIRSVYDLIGGEAVLDYQTFLDDFHELQTLHRKEFQIFPEAKELLLRAKAVGKHNYIYTHTGPVVKEMLTDMGVLDCFDFVLDASYNFPFKPAPDALLFFLDKFKLEPETCMMIGDRPIDAHAGMNAGMYGCLWDSDGLFSNGDVDYYIKELSEISRIVGM